jgi:broad specificity phosphatase PhoE
MVPDFFVNLSVFFTENHQPSQKEHIMPNNITTKNVEIAVMRHGNKNDDSLTPLGERQIKAAVKALFKRGFDFGHIAHSPTVRTRQCADIAQTAIKGHHFFVYREINGLSFEAPFAEAFDGDMEAYKKDLQKVVETGNTVAAAREINNYSHLARQHLSNYLFSFAEEIVNLGEKDLGRKQAICFSHSPFHTLAVPEKWAASVPYEAPEASCVVYTIQDGNIIDAEFILAPIVE